MTKDIWINLPVQNLEAAKTFFRETGFRIHPQHENNKDMAGVLIGDKEVLVMLFPEQTFQSFVHNEVSDTRKSTEVLLSIDAASRDEVDTMAHKVVAAGGVVFSEPQEIQGWMYGAGFTDLDGHRWNILYMDMENMPQT